MERLEHFFRLKDHKTTVSTEIAAGFTTFITMSYIILVNPELIASGVAAAGGPSDAVFNGVLIATCLASFIGTILMALYAKLPLAQAPGMGINAFFAFSVIVGFGMTYQEALAIVFISGVLFILITACGLRELIIRCIPTSVQEALPVGIGMFIAFVGMQNAGLVVHNDSTLIAFADFSAISDPDQKVAVYGCLLALLGLFIMAALHALHVKAAILIGIIAVTIIGIPLGVTTLPESFSVNFSEPFSDFTTYSLGSFIEGFDSLFAGQNLLSTIFTILILVLSFSLVDMFDTLGALISVSKKVDFKDADGNPVGMKKSTYVRRHRHNCRRGLWYIHGYHLHGIHLRNRRRRTNRPYLSYNRSPAPAFYPGPSFRADHPFGSYCACPYLCRGYDAPVSEKYSVG